MRTPKKQTSTLLGDIDVSKRHVYAPLSVQLTPDVFLACGVNWWLPVKVRKGAML
jgi:hypothetical protein